ncbi:MAG TPA: HAD family hydrolase [Gammaproteobacteria bacterium]|nr:HAD family hydrolase [Gammaproteobacteria bacterium]
MINTLSPTRINTVLFDLDGTLADTAPDLAAALNAVRLSKGKPALPFEKIRPAVSRGGKALIEVGFNLPPDSDKAENLRLQLLDHYRENIACHTRLFPGMDRVLAHIENNGSNWGVVTNKPGWLTEPLMAELNLKQRAACIVSGDTLDERKPHPAPLLHACQLAGSPPEHCVYIGDAERDMIAGNRAGMHTLLALFGYIGETDRPLEWGADATLKSPEELLHWLIKAE